MLNSAVPRKPDISISIYQENTKEPSPSRVASRRNSLSKFPSFKPLPPMPESSPLCTSFLDFSSHSTTPLPEPHSKTALPAIPSSTLPQQSYSALVQGQPRNDHLTTQKIHDEPFLIPAIQHPNSPYVPWAPPVRRRILRPAAPTSHVSLLSSHYSRPTSRSGARAPEPVETPEPVRTLSPAWRGWKQFRQSISHGASRIATYLGALKRPLANRQPVSSCTAKSDAIQIRSISPEDTFFVTDYSPSPTPPLAALTGRRPFTPSTVSLASSDSATLAAWLATRRRVALEERDYDPGSLMTLDEYERMGSWLDLSGDRKIDGKWMCGVPGCDIHARHMLLHGGHVTSLDFSVKESNPGPSKSIRVSQRAALSLQFNSSPQFQNDGRAGSTRGRPASATPGDGSLLSTSLSDRRPREMSMPGGWII